MVQQKILIKILVIGLIAIVLLIPLGLIRGTISERQSYRETARYDIASSWTNNQSVIGPVLIVPYKERVNVEVYDEKLKQNVVKEQIRSNSRYFLPDSLTVDAGIDLQERYRGIFAIPVYTSRISMIGSFKLPARFGITASEDRVTMEQAFISMGISDIRGIREDLQFTWEKGRIEMEPGTNKSPLPNGVHAKLGLLEPSQPRSYAFTFDLGIQGMDKIEFAPLGKTTVIKAQSKWPHPMFVGRFLPEQRDISAGGFNAVWKTTHFATNSEQTLANCVNNDCSLFLNETLGVAFREPVDIYHQAERSVKYGLLFMTLTFVVFFLFEILKRLIIHPVQYGLVGAALALFYLLLISLSEHLDFAIAYTIASAACAALLSFYVSFVLRSLWRGLSFGALLSCLYGVLYVVLKSEDYALLMGSLLLFAALSAVMVLTRKIDWYELGSLGTESRNRLQPVSE